MEITIAKTVADALDRLVNKSGTGLKALIAAKLDKATADTYYWKRTEKVTNATNADNATNANYATTAGSANSATTATKATNDGNGANIANTYAKKSDIPSTSNLLTKSQADGYYLGKSDTAAKATSDANGANIANTYAKKSDIPDTSKFLALESNTYYAIGDNDIRTTSGFWFGEYNGELSLGIRNGMISIKESERTVKITSLGYTYEFKSDGIYLNDTKITN